ncbi:MAG: hypothetical protein SangKO_059590 [Sandaracinaceae bacterium]
MTCSTSRVATWAAFGALFVPSRSELIEFGSHVGLDDFLWAHHRGVDLAGATKWDRSNTPCLPSETPTWPWIT